MFETNKKRLKSSRGMSAYDSVTVSSAKELTSVSMRYSHRGTERVPPCLGLCTVPTISSRARIRDSSCVMVCMVIFRGTVMCYQGRK